MEWLKIENFIETKGLYLSEAFCDLTLLELLGKPQASWLDSLLTKLGVSDQPLNAGARVAEGSYISGRVYLGEGASVEPTAMIQGPCIIAPGAQVRHGAYIRGQVYVGAKAVVGHATEVKGSIFCDDAKAGHFAYVGDSILGRDVNLGAGTKLANLKLRKDEVKLSPPDGVGKRVATGLNKLGAIMGDCSQTGCNAVLSPGTILMPHTIVMSCAHFQGTLTKGLFR